MGAHSPLFERAKQIARWGVRRGLIPKKHEEDCAQFAAQEMIKNPRRDSAKYIVVDFVRVICGRRENPEQPSKTSDIPLGESIELFAGAGSLEDELIEKIDRERRLAHMLEHLNKSERAIVELVLAGFLQREIAELFEITESAVSFRMRGIMTKLKTHAALLADLENRA